MKSRSYLLLMTAALVVVGLAGEAGARIKLAALPVRERVEIQLDNGRFTLVEEERIIPLLKSTANGSNMIDFSWSSTLIDKDSIQFRPLSILEGEKFRPVKTVKTKEGEEVPEVGVISVSYPPGENALVWEVFAHDACAVKVRVSYLISNLTRSFSYRAVADHDETQLVLRNFLNVSNYSGEDFGSATVWAGFGDSFKKLIEQQIDIKMLLHRFAKVPVDKTFTFDWYTNGPLNADKPLASRVLMHYRLMNDEAHGLGEYPLPPGKVRIFIEDGKGGEAFLGEDWAKLTPLDSEMKLYLGEARDLVCTRTIESNERHHVKGNLYNQEIIIKYEIENYKDKPVTLRIIEQLNRVGQEYFGDTHGDVEWEQGRKTSRDLKVTIEEDGVSPVLEVELPARPKGDNDKVEKKAVRFHVTLNNLWN